MRIVFFYLICFLVLWKLLDYHKLVDNAVPETMSRLTPPMDYFADFTDHPAPYNELDLMSCVYYHKAVADFFPFQRSEAYGMLGFCYDRLGQERNAVDAYKKAIALNSDYFWPYYDLGVIEYRHGRYQQAQAFFEKALEQQPIRTVVLLSRSKVYNDIRLSRQNAKYDFLEGLKEGRFQAYISLMDCLFRTQSYDLLWKTAVEGLKDNLDNQAIFDYYAGVGLFFVKDYQKAVAFLQMAIQNDPSNADAYLYLGMCLHAMGNEPLAALMMGKASALHQQGSGWQAIGPYLKPQVRFF